MVSLRQFRQGKEREKKGMEKLGRVFVSLYNFLCNSDFWERLWDKEEGRTTFMEEVIENRREHTAHAGGNSAHYYWNSQHIVTDRARYLYDRFMIF